MSDACFEVLSHEEMSKAADAAVEAADGLQEETPFCAADELCTVPDFQRYNSLPEQLSITSNFYKDVMCNGSILSSVVNMKNAGLEAGVQVEVRSNGFDIFELANSTPVQPSLRERASSLDESFSSRMAASNSIPRSSSIDLNSEESTERIKVKLKSVWNNVKYGWTINIRPQFNLSKPICLLGCFYKKDPTKNVSEELNRYQLNSLEDFKRDFASRLWFTYRRGFRPLNASSALVTDCGWGCMLRSAQMLLAQTLLTHFLGRSWSLYSEQSRRDVIYHRQIVRWFGDDDATDCPFSLHQLVRLSDRAAGEWFGPVSAAHVLSKALAAAVKSAPELERIKMYIATENRLFADDLRDLCARNHNALLVMVPVWAGGERGFNPIYIPCLQAILSQTYCVGIIGGRPRHSMWFVGFQDDKILYLDPHLCQEAVPVLNDDFPLNSYHCMTPRKMLFTNLDPSCSIGFYLRSQRDLELMLSVLPQLLLPTRQSNSYPMFEICAGRRCDHAEEERQLTLKKQNNSDTLLRLHTFDVQDGRHETSEYVFM